MPNCSGADGIFIFSVYAWIMAELLARSAPERRARAVSRLPAPFTVATVVEFEGVEAALADDKTQLVGAVG